MALYFFTALLFAIFSGLFYLASPERVAGPENYQTGIAGLFDACYAAGTAEAYANTGFGNTVADKRACLDHAIAGYDAPLTTSRASNLYAPDIHIVARPMADLKPGLTGRSVATYVVAGTTVNGAAFTEVVRQVQQYYLRRTGIGQVQSYTGTANKIDNGNGIIVLVPIDVPVGAIAAVTRVD